MSGQRDNDTAREQTARHLLVAVDGSENSKRAIQYVADFFSGDRDLHISVLSIIPEPSEDYFATDGERRQWLTTQQEEMAGKIAGYRDILLASGFGEGQLDSRLIVRQCESIGDAILEEQEKMGCCLVVVGRRGLSHNEEFIFGSTSNRILHRARNCAVMVVE